MYCNFCNAEIPDGSAICPRCGENLQAVASQSFAATPAPQEKRLYVPALVLSIIGLPFALLLPIVTYPCSTIALVFSITKRATHKTTASLVMSIIGLVVALINSIAGVILVYNAGLMLM
jgi:uncharacterized paraquat-inducible protein A